MLTPQDEHHWFHCLLGLSVVLGVLRRTLRLPSFLGVLGMAGGGVDTLVRASWRCRSAIVVWDCSSALKAVPAEVFTIDGMVEPPWSSSSRRDKLFCSEMITLLKTSLMLVWAASALAMEFYQAGDILCLVRSAGWEITVLVDEFQS